jgi:hypothetical protein
LHKRGIDQRKVERRVAASNEFCRKFPYQKITIFINTAGQECTEYTVFLTVFLRKIERNASSFFLLILQLNKIAKPCQHVWIWKTIPFPLPPTTLSKYFVKQFPYLCAS